MGRKKIKIIHAGIDSTSPREQQSIEQLKSLGERYIRIENTPYDEEPPLEEIYKGRKDWYVGKEKDYNQFYVVFILKNGCNPKESAFAKVVGFSRIVLEQALSRWQHPFIDPLTSDFG